MSSSIVIYAKVNLTDYFPSPYILSSAVMKLNDSILVNMTTKVRLVVDKKIKRISFLYCRLWLCIGTRTICLR